MKTNGHLKSQSTPVCTHMSLCGSLMGRKVFCATKIVFCDQEEKPSNHPSIHPSIHPSRPTQSPPCVCPCARLLIPHILPTDPGPLCQAARWTADRCRNIPERPLSQNNQRPLWDLLSWSLPRDNSSQRGPADAAGARLSNLLGLPGPRKGLCVTKRRGRAHTGALPDRRYKTEAPGSPKALREAGGRVPL